MATSKTNDEFIKNIYYNIDYTITFPDNSEKPYTGNDVYSLYHIRCPYIKTASLTMLTIPIEFIRLRAIQNYLEVTPGDNPSSDHPLMIELEYSLVDISKPINRNYQKIRAITTKQFYILNCQPLEPDILQPKLAYNYSITCRLTLVNPTLYFLNTLNIFNRKYLNVVPIDILGRKTQGEQTKKSFCEYLTKDYGDSFQINSIYTDKNLNDAKYEQVIIRASNDLAIPKHINDMYKIYKYPCLMFFDEFALGKNIKRDIVFYNICLESPITPGIEQINIYNRLTSDASVGTVQIRTSTLSDNHGVFNYKKGSTRINVRDNTGYQRDFWINLNNDIDTKPPTEKGEIRIPISRVKNKDSINSRSGDIITYEKSHKIKKNTSTSFFKLYAPDGVEDWQFQSGGYRGWWDRFRMTDEFLRKRTRGIYEYFSNFSHFDYYQFNRVYNLDPTNINDFSFQPISICNIFHRAEPKMTACLHSAKINMLRYNWDLIEKGEM